MVSSRLIVEKWNVKSAVYKEPVSRHSRRNLIGKAILTLQDSQFVAKSSSSKNVEDPLAEVDEILLNTTWRFLTLRDYVDLNHELTAWGKMLVAVINALEDPKLEEAAIVAVELLRLGMLNWDADMFPYAGAPGRGDAQDKKYNLLISRVAGLSSLRHQQIGYTGPLSRHLLGYNSVINAVRSRLRDLVEVTATQMFLSACAKRDIKVKDMTQIAMSLPFLGPVNSLLSVAVKTYLDELATGRPKEDVQDDARRLWFPRAEDLLADMETAFKLFDAVNKGVQASGNLVKESEKQGWKQASEWLAKRR
ncbi:hypothetical protein M011DRAFT_219635 [Sporormia fimetaria CBS 119925]|uniref:Post-transcriptional regulator MKT1 C-terminal domain-containing protein n=1 Tax=Sporormia fimetaria CBS 119925 TaxID=1340428 RepID=A0A6A6V1B0_9PLEO|nr:hypothetical protein M011DRAFT_219635 [Sporormia fimetaria CBS 119925]